MPTTIDHEVEPWRWRDLREFIIHQLSKGRVPSMENSTHHYDAIFIRGLRTHNMSLWNSTWPDIRPDYETTGPDVVPDECFPLLGLLDFFHLYYMPAIILIGKLTPSMSLILVSLWSFSDALQRLKATGDRFQYSNNDKQISTTLDVPNDKMRGLNSLSLMR